MKKGKYIDSKGNYKKNALKELIALCQDADYKEKKQTFKAKMNTDKDRESNQV